MHTPVLQVSYPFNHFFCVSIRREKWDSRSRALDLKPGIPFCGLIFVRDSSWKRSNGGFGRSLLGGFASMAFSGGNGGFGKSDDNSGERGDGEDGNGNNLLGSWILPEDTWKEAILLALWKLLRRSLPTQATQAVDLCLEILAPFVFVSIKPIIPFLDALFEIVLPCTLFMVILTAAFCVFGSFYCVKGVIRGSEENASSPPDNVVSLFLNYHKRLKENNLSTQIKKYAGTCEPTLLQFRSGCSGLNPALFFCPTFFEERLINEEK